MPDISLEAFRDRIRPFEFPYIYEQFEPISGKIKCRSDDFVVDEVLAYEPSGEGEHLFVRMEKHDIAMEDFFKLLRTVLDVPQTEVGYAGLKDKVAVTRQTFSLPASCEARLPLLEEHDVKILDVSRHTNRLKVGHLRGNRFDILLKGVPEEQRELAVTVGHHVANKGMVNIYGNQRFGRGFESVRVGWDVMAGNMRIQSMSRMKRRFVVSALQSFLFNSYCLYRYRKGLLHTVLTGDIMKKCESGGMFTVEDSKADQLRLDDGEITVTGPMYWKKLMTPRGLSYELEMEHLAGYGMTLDSFAKFHSLAQGARRPTMIFAKDLEASVEERGVRFRFFLPKGCYATVFLREVCKQEF